MERVGVKRFLRFSPKQQDGSVPIFFQGKDKTLVHYNLHWKHCTPPLTVRADILRRFKHSHSFSQFFSITWKRTQQ